MTNNIHLHRHVPAGLRGESIHNAPVWKPLNWRLATPLRPGALDHEKHGSVKPYAKTVHGCVGFLKDKTSNARD